MAEAIKYKDHAVVYGSGKGTDAAYINETFKGILRLSPNSSTTFNIIVFYCEIRDRVNLENIQEDDYPCSFPPDTPCLRQVGRKTFL